MAKAHFPRETKLTLKVLALPCLCTSCKARSTEQRLWPVPHPWLPPNPTFQKLIVYPMCLPSFAPANSPFVGRTETQGTLRSHFSTAPRNQNVPKRDAGRRRRCSCLTLRAMEGLHRFMLPRRRGRAPGPGGASRSGRSPGTSAWDPAWHLGGVPRAGRVQGRGSSSAVPQPGNPEPAKSTHPSLPSVASPPPRFLLPSGGPRAPETTRPALPASGNVVRTRPGAPAPGALTPGSGRSFQPRCAQTRAHRFPGSRGQAARPVAPPRHQCSAGRQLLRAPLSAARDPGFWGPR